MDQVSNSTASMVMKVVFVIVMLVVLYYLYQFLFSSSGLEGQILLNTVSPASPDKPYTYDADVNLPVMLTGGEYSVNTWIYINDYSVNRGQNKHVLNIGGSSYSSLVLFLGPYNNSLSVRVKTDDSANGELSNASLTSLFTTMQTGSTLLDTNTPCDIPVVELQKWIQVTVTLNNKTCDVYIDGKLARSCILPSFFRADKVNPKMSLCNYKGFGGFITNTSAYNYSLNPEQIWRLYMSGPGPQYTLYQYFMSLFDPKAALSFDYPKQNITH
jgi:hypothetical protein